MRPPEFWNHRDGPEAKVLKRTLLEPVGWSYDLAGALRRAATTPHRSKATVICVGNLTLGGAGKTPVSIAILERLRARGVEAHALSRGYGGSKRGPLRVERERHTYRQVGDEPLLLARMGPTWVAKSKIAGAKAAVRQGAEALVMDDGFQNPTLAKDLSLVLIDAEAGLGNGRVFPAGPLRENARGALKRADAVVVVSAGPEPDMRAAWRNYLPQGTPVLIASLQPSAPPPPSPVFAFAGIARPQKFFDALMRAGADLKATTTFPDHHVYTKADLANLRDNARRRNALLLTTEKDLVRIPSDMARTIHAWPVRVVFQDEARLDSLIDRALDRASSR